MWSVISFAFGIFLQSFSTLTHTITPLLAEGKRERAYPWLQPKFVPLLTGPPLSSLHIYIASQGKLFLSPIFLLSSFLFSSDQPRSKSSYMSLIYNFISLSSPPLDPSADPVPVTSFKSTQWSHRFYLSLSLD